MLYTNFWQNTGMPDQPIWVFSAERKDAKFGERVGDYCAVSADMSRHYRIMYNGVCAEYEGFCYYPDGKNWDDVEHFCCAFVEHCEEVFSKGRAFVYHDEIAENMLEMSVRLGLGWVSEEWRDAYEDCIVIYSSEFAKKAHIGEHAIYCYSEEAMHETVQELSQDGYIVEFSGEVEDCIQIYPDGSYDLDRAYVVTWEEPKPTVAEKLDQIEQRLIEIEAIWEDRGITDATAEPEWEEFEDLSYLQAEILIREEV